MIDLVSTRGDVDPQTRSCLALLTSVVTQAVLDACTPFTREEAAAGPLNQSWEAVEALEFLFGANGMFETYASIIGADAANLRAALLGDHDLRVIGQFEEANRRVLQRRHTLWLRCGASNVILPSEFDDEKEAA